MATEHVLGIDEGTTGVRGIVFDDASRIVGEAYRTFEQHYPQPGWVEHDAEEVRDVALRTARDAIADADLDAADLAAVGITNQRETTLLWDRATGEPLHRAIVWQDRRTAGMCEALEEAGHGDRVKELTGLVLDAYFSGTKVRWLLDHVPGARKRADAGEVAFGTMDTWLLWNLTDGAVHATDPSNASRTLLYDIDAMAWSEELCELLDVPMEVLPEVRDSSGSFGTTHADALGAEVPIGGVAGDQQAALFGQACFREGMVKNTYGTGSFLLMNTGAERVESPDLLSTVAWRIDGEVTYALEGSVFVSGAAVQWIRDELGLFEGYEELDALLEAVDGTDGVVFVPALTGMGAPHWDPHARGTLLGLTRGTTRAHIARATLEAAAYQSRDVIDAMETAADTPLRRVRVDGGMTANEFLLSFQADVLDVPVERPEIAETTVLGAAYLAGLHADVWASQEEIAEAWRRDDTWYSHMPEDERARLLQRWERGVERAKGWESGEDTSST